MQKRLEIFDSQKKEYIVRNINQHFHSISSKGEIRKNERATEL